jgi:hypothetical protein
VRNCPYMNDVTAGALTAWRSPGACHVWRYVDARTPGAAIPRCQPWRSTAACARSFEAQFRPPARSWRSGGYLVRPDRSVYERPTLVGKRSEQPSLVVAATCARTPRSRRQQGRCRASRWRLRRTRERGAGGRYRNHADGAVSAKAFPRERGLLLVVQLGSERRTAASAADCPFRRERAARSAVGRLSSAPKGVEPVVRWEARRAWTWLTGLGFPVWYVPGPGWPGAGSRRWCATNARPAPDGARSGAGQRA